MFQRISLKIKAINFLRTLSVATTEEVPSLYSHDLIRFKTVILPDKCPQRSRKKCNIQTCHNMRNI